MLFLNKGNKFAKMHIKKSFNCNASSKSFAIMYLFLIFQVSFKEKESKKKKTEKTYYLHQIH